MLGFANAQTDFRTEIECFIIGFFVHIHSRDKSLSQTFCFYNRVHPVPGSDRGFGQFSMS